METILANILRFFPEIVFIIGIGFFIKRILFFKNGARAFAEVTGIEERKYPYVSGNSWANRIVYHPILYFDDKSGKRYRCVAGMLGRFMSYNSGEKVPIIYKESNPMKSLVNSFFIVWTIPTIFLIVGLSAIVLKYKT